VCVCACVCVCVCACVKGCMNNVTFGDENVGYYETVAGGAGAVS